VAEVPAQQPQAPASYVPAPVAFVSGDDSGDEYGRLGSDGYGSAADGAAPGGQGASGAGVPGWQDPARTVPDKVMDVSAPRRRPVVFEEDDDLDVPDFLK
jgi:cell division protein FtsZ